MCEGDIYLKYIVYGYSLLFLSCQKTTATQEEYYKKERIAHQAIVLNDVANTMHYTAHFELNKDYNYRKIIKKASCTVSSIRDCFYFFKQLSHQTKNNKDTLDNRGMLQTGEEGLGLDSMVLYLEFPTYLDTFYEKSFYKNISVAHFYNTGTNIPKSTYWEENAPDSSYFALDPAIVNKYKKYFLYGYKEGNKRQLNAVVYPLKGMEIWIRIRYFKGQENELETFYKVLETFEIAFS